MTRSLDFKHVRVILKSPLFTNLFYKAHYGVLVYSNDPVACEAYHMANIIQFYFFINITV